MNNLNIGAEEYYDIKVYSKEDCPACDLVMRKLLRNNIKFSEIHLTEKTIKYYKSIGVEQAPILILNGAFSFSGYNFEVISEIIEKYKSNKPINPLEG